MLEYVGLPGRMRADVRGMHAVRLTIAAIPVIVGEFELSIREPGIVRHIAFEKKAKLVMRAGDAEFEEAPVLFVESSPDAPVRKRKYFTIAHGEVINVTDGDVAVWQGTGMSARGLIVHVFELTQARS